MPRKGIAPVNQPEKHPIEVVMPVAAGVLKVAVPALLGGLAILAAFLSPREVIPVLLSLVMSAALVAIFAVLTRPGVGGIRKD